MQCSKIAPITSSAKPYIDETLLQRTAGPYMWVIFDRGNRAWQGG
jgi:hypothetical protein